MSDAAAARERRIGWACAMMLLAVWASFHLVSRHVARESLTPWDIAALRYGGAFLCVLPFLALRGLPRIAPGRLPAVLVFAGFGFPLLAYAGFALAPAAHGATIMAAGLPAVTALLGLATGMGRLAARQWLGILGIVLGSLALAVVGGGAETGAWRGDLLFLAAVSSWAVYTLLVQRWALPAIDTTLAIGLLAAPIYLPIWWLILPSGLAEASWGAILGQAAFQGVGAAVVAGILYTRSVAALGPTITTMIGAAVPGIVAAAAWPLLGETLAPAGMLAVLAVSAGLVLGMGRAR
ncbi:DMT family transporter [Roseomonas sp. PWR1]|uniref:DMT family transporter n=1 Tax=Roseomonas nitratireducens TaxID=2820810 RepID=A0ABS4ASQ2_9PROT|nr:DMT family transporter [Neoroseomonas nitratireducens]MBP0464394.1 DMT family transporter [Neoroseomonas nitratireducens]